MRVSLSGIRSGSRRAERVIKIIRRIARIVGAAGSVEIVFLKGDVIRSLKRKLLPRNRGPANVIAVPDAPGFPHPEAPSPPLGTIYLNRDCTAGQPEEKARLLIHGFLHLLGYDHKRKRDILTMENIEAELWQRISSRG